MDENNNVIELTKKVSEWTAFGKRRELLKI